MSGIYLHIPFCKQKCTYCDFHFSTTFSSYRENMIETMLQEIISRKDYLAGEALESIYFGGGTPSLLSAAELRSFMDTIRSHFKIESQAEITLEANPDDITIVNLMSWRTLGINRLSIGLQSFKTADLEWMNRAHSVSEALNCVKLAQENGFENISVDLIYGLPDLTLKEWESHIDNVLNMGIQHVSAYCLTVEKKTALHQMVKTHKIKPAGENDQSDQFLLLSKRMKEAGFHHYEISNFGLPGYEAIHNSNYWKGKKYLGIGPSAHSFDGNTRRWNISSNQLYMKHFGKDGSWYEIEKLTLKDRWNELIMTGLRTSHGVDLDQLRSLHTFTKSFQRTLNQFEKNAWLKIENNRIVLSDEGRLMADHIASELFLD